MMMAGFHFPTIKQAAAGDLSQARPECEPPREQTEGTFSRLREPKSQVTLEGGDAATCLHRR